MAKPPQASYYLQLHKNTQGRKGEGGGGGLEPLRARRPPYIAGVSGLEEQLLPLLLVEERHELARVLVEEVGKGNSEWLGHLGRKLGGQERVDDYPYLRSAMRVS